MLLIIAIVVCCWLLILLTVDVVVVVVVVGKQFNPALCEDDSMKQTIIAKSHKQQQ